MCLLWSTNWVYIPEEDILHSHRRENLKSYTLVLYFVLRVILGHLVGMSFRHVLGNSLIKHQSLSVCLSVCLSDFPFQLPFFPAVQVGRRLVFPWQGDLWRDLLENQLCYISCCVINVTCHGFNTEVSVVTEGNRATSPADVCIWSSELLAWDFPVHLKKPIMRLPFACLLLKKWAAESRLAGRILAKRIVMLWFVSRLLKGWVMELKIACRRLKEWIMELRIAYRRLKEWIMELIIACKLLKGWIMS
jgi:hypothetical protein